MGVKGILGSIADGIGEAIADIRHKVVEEGMYGHQVTDTEKTTDITNIDIEVRNTENIRANFYGTDHDQSWRPETPSFEKQWERKARDRDQEAPDQGHGYDR